MTPAEALAILDRAHWGDQTLRLAMEVAIAALRAQTQGSIEAAPEAADQARLRMLSSLLSNGVASTWEEVILAAESVESMRAKLAESFAASREAFEEGWDAAPIAKFERDRVAALARMAEKQAMTDTDTDTAKARAWIASISAAAIPPVMQSPSMADRAKLLQEDILNVLDEET